MREIPSPTSLECTGKSCGRGRRWKRKTSALHEGKTRKQAFACGRAPPEDALRRLGLVFDRGIVIFVVLSSARQLFTSYSHLPSSLPASGLRLEMGQRTDKNISEVYFAACFKIILTQNVIRQVVRISQSHSARVGLTAPPQSRNFAARDRRTEVLRLTCHASKFRTVCTFSRAKFQFSPSPPDGGCFRIYLPGSSRAGAI